jgi:hypothetical protein
MNDNDPFVSDLQRLGRAMTPEDGFVDRVMSRIERPRSMRRRWMVPLTTAAAVLLVVGYFTTGHLQQVTPPPAGEGLRLVGTTSEWQTSARRVLLEGEVPAQEISRQRFERLEWDDAQSHAKFQRMVPKEKITFISADSY